MFAVTHSGVTSHVKTQLPLLPTPAVLFVKVGFFKSLRQCVCEGSLKFSDAECVCVYHVGCGVNGNEFSNGAVVPTGERCQECKCVVCHFILIFIIVLYFCAHQLFGF